MGINISTLANGVVTAISNNTLALYYRFKSIDNTGLLCVNTYEDPVSLWVMIQNSNRQTLRNTSGYSETRVYRDLWIDTYASGLNWSQQCQQDKFVINGLVYYVIKQVHDFNNQMIGNGWVHVVVAESTDAQENPILSERLG